MICKKCMHESYCDMAQFGGHNPPITGCCKFKERHQTNSDRIRAMTDEELASLLMYFADDTDGIDEKDYDAFGDMEWRERMLRWLKQEVTD